MSDLRFAIRQLEELSEHLNPMNSKLSWRNKRQKRAIRQIWMKLLFLLRPVEPGESDEVYITLAFKWKTEAELREIFLTTISMNGWQTETD
jgi:hypothetical protein